MKNFVLHLIIALLTLGSSLSFAFGEYDYIEQVQESVSSEDPTTPSTETSINTDEDGTQATLENPQTPSKYYFLLPVSSQFIWGGHFGPRLIGSLKYAEALYQRHLKNPTDTKLEIVPIAKRSSRRSSNKLVTQFHIGTDIIVPKGTPVNAVYKGSVYAMGYMACPGYTVAIKHEIPGEDKPVYTLYKHLNGLPSHLRVGDQVNVGDVIALSGVSGQRMRIRGGKKVGCIAGAHLHFEVRIPSTDGNNVLLNETPEVQKKLTSTRLNLIALSTTAVNPADYIAEIDQACFEKKNIEITNAILVQSKFPNAVAPLSAGLCSEMSEERFKQKFATLPAIYHSIMFN